MDPLTLFAVASAGSALAQGLAVRSQAMSNAARLDAEAKLAETQALQRDTQARDELRRTIGAIQAARAANGLSAYSPNAILLEKTTSEVSRREREIQVTDYRQHAMNKRNDAAAARASGRMSLLTNVVSAAVPIAQSRL